MKSRVFFWLRAGTTCALSFLPIWVHAFALLGPYADWMDEQKGYRRSGDIGGPMNIGEGYRWNIPVITYGFDRSFLDYFGSNGVAAVESAIAIINQIPPASAIDPHSYPNAVWRNNFLAQAEALADLKSQVLSTLLEEMGLSDPVRWTFCLRDLQPSGTNYLYYTIRRNFDVLSGQSSAYVNGTLFTYSVYQIAPSAYDAVEARIDPLQPLETAATQRPRGYGAFSTGLSSDDAGGLRYLLNQSQIRVEELLPDIHLPGGKPGNLIRTAYRPGIDKITFAFHPVGSLSGEFWSFTNTWTDIYYDFDGPALQQVERVNTRPDILFRGQDLGVQFGWTRTGATNWVNNAGLNDNPGGAGPGVIQPPIVITFNTLGPFYMNSGPTLDQPNSILFSGWASFDGTTNLPFPYPNVQITFQPTQVHFQMLVAGGTNDFTWRLAGPAYSRFLFQTTTDLTDWTILTTLTNSGAPFDYLFSALTNEPARFFRTIPTP